MYQSGSRLSACRLRLALPSAPRHTPSSALVLWQRCHVRRRLHRPVVASITSSGSSASSIQAVSSSTDNSASSSGSGSSDGSSSSLAKASAGLWPALRLAFDVLRPDAWLLATTTVVLLATIGTTLYFPLIIGTLFDLVRDATASGPLAQVGFMATLATSPAPFRRVLTSLVFCLVLSTAGNTAVAILSPLLAERCATRLRLHLMEALLQRDQAFFDATPKGDLVSRLSLDVSVLQTTLADYLGQRGFRSFFEVVGALGLMAARQPLLAAVALLVTPSLGRLLRVIVVRSTAISAERQAAAAEALDFAAERLRHVRTVQVFDQEAREAASFARLSERGRALALRFAAFQGVVEGGGRMAINAATLSLLGVGGWLVLAGKASVGTVLAAQVQSLFLSVGLSSMAASLGELGRAVGALERIAELAGGTASSSGAAGASGSLAWALQPDAEAGAVTEEAGLAQGQEEPSISGRVEFRDVWFRYPGSRSDGDWVLRDFSLSIEPGQTVALVGASGGGKSTVAALLLGLYTPQRGEVLVDGLPLSDSAALARIRACTAAVLQNPMLLSGSVKEVIAYGRPTASAEEVHAAAAAANADGFIALLPDGYASPVGERGHALSGGQKQRLAIARALLMQPKILVLDEVTSALDVESELAVDASLRLLPGTTKLVIAHRLSTVRHADVIAVVQGGRVVERGTHAQLEALGGHYWRLLQSAELFDHGLSDCTPDGNQAARPLATLSAD